MPPKNTVHSGSSGDLNSVGRKSSVAASTSVTSKTSFNRFSTFVKSGGENYILGKLNAKVQEADIIQVVVSKSLSGISMEVNEIWFATEILYNLFYFHSLSEGSRWWNICLVEFQASVFLQHSISKKRDKDKSTQKFYCISTDT